MGFGKRWRTKVSACALCDRLAPSPGRSTHERAGGFSNVRSFVLVKRADLEHLIRAAATIADDDELIVVGSQAVLAQFPDAPES